MKDCIERTFILSETMDDILAYDSDRAEAMALLHAIDDYIRMQGFCSINDLEDLGVDVSDIRSRTSWTFCGNWGWTDSQMDGTGVEKYSPSLHIIQLGKPVDLTFEHRWKSLFEEPCKSCINSCNFTPRKESKGENKMDYTTTLKASEILNNLESPYINRYPANYISEHHGIDPNSLIPNRIWFNSHDTLFFTTVQWMDGTKTTVAIPEDEHATEYSGFTAALAKKIFGTTCALKNMELAVEKAKEPAKRKAAQRKALKDARQHAHELRMKEREDRIKREMEQERIRREAQRRLDTEELNEAFPKTLGKIRKALKGGKK